MEWWQLLFALLVITFYVLKHIVSLQQDQQRRTPPAQVRVRDVLQPAPAVMSDAETERDRTELDQRIEEAKQRRRELQDAAEPVASPLPKRVLPMPAPLVMRPVLRAERPVATGSATAPAAPTPDVAPAMAVNEDLPVLPRVLELLRNRNSMAAAMVLRAVLDRPASVRRRR